MCAGGCTDYIFALPPSRPYRHWVPATTDWLDQDGWGCATYLEDKWCGRYAIDDQGDYGAEPRGEYANDANLTANQACCGCGGGSCVFSTAEDCSVASARGSCRCQPQSGAQLTGAGRWLCDFYYATGMMPFAT